MNRKMSDEQKIEMVEKYKTGNYTCLQLGKEYGVRKEAINNMLRVRGIEILQKQKNSQFIRKYTLNEHYFDIIDTEDKAYWLGWLYSDGCNKITQISIGLQHEDVQILENFKLSLGCNNPLYFRNRSCKNPNWKDTSELTISSRYMCEQLTKLGCVPAKSLILKFPTEEQVPSHLIRHFIRGYFEGDGHISSYNKNGCSNSRFYCNITSNIDFCNGFSDILSSINIKSLIVNPKPKSNKSTRRVCIGNRYDIIKFLDWIYVDSHYILQRKYNKYIECKDTFDKIHYNKRQNDSRLLLIYQEYMNNISVKDLSIKYGYSKTSIYDIINKFKNK